MTLDQLINVLTDLRDSTSGDRPVHVGIQPGYPLALTMAGVADGGELARIDGVDDSLEEDLEPEVSEAVWLLAGDSHPVGVAHLDSDLWNVAERGW